jgi:hypothetical protein
MSQSPDSVDERRVTATWTVGTTSENAYYFLLLA